MEKTKISPSLQSQLGSEPSFAPLLTISERKKSGLILCRDHYAEFAGPGAAICNLNQADYKLAFAIGAPELILANTPEARQQAYSRRIQWLRWLQKIVEQEEPIARAEKLIAGFEAFFGHGVVVQLPSDILALLIGVFPQTIDQVRLQNRSLAHSVSHLRFGLDQIKVTTIDLNLQSGMPVLEVLSTPNEEKPSSLLPWTA